MKAGTIVAERFLVGEHAGQGGMGTVYRAHDRHLGQEVALKVISGSGGDDRERFEREARVLAALSHPAIVDYVAHGVTAIGDLYLAMQWLEGETLAARLRREPVSLADAIVIAQRCADALGRAHAEGVIHRDVKPENLFLVDGAAEHLMVIDFGIARAGTTSLTSAGVVVGTPQFMSPEQARGDRNLDGRTDVYSLGAVLFEMLTGIPPFEADTAVALIGKILLEEPPPPSELNEAIPPPLEELVLRCLAKDRATRPPDMAALGEELSRLGSGALEAGVAQARPAAPAPALTDVEQRLLCMIMTPGVVALDVSAPTMVGGEEEALDSQIRDAVKRHGGSAEVLPDGAVIATIKGRGTPAEHAERAARCALALRELIPRGPIALVAGRGVVTTRMPVGDVIDRGADVLDLGDAELPRERRIRLDRVIAGFLSGDFEIVGDDHGLSLRGPIDVGGTERTVLGKSSPLVGRRRELGILEATLGEVVEEPVARAVLVIGEPGAGKSRLVRELVARAVNESPTPTILTGDGDVMRAGAPFAPLGEAVRRAAAIRDGESLQIRRDKLRARLGRHLDLTAVSRVAPFVAEMARAPFDDEESEALRAARRDPQLMGDGIRSAFVAWLDAELDAAPVILCLDDLQYGDAPTVALVDHALRVLSHRPLLVLGAARPEIEGLFPDIWADRGVDGVRLSRLTPGSAGKLIDAVMGDGVLPELRERLIERADGNPFFLEELLRVVDEGEGDELPASVAGILEARLHALDDDLRRVLRAASVFGETFSEPGLVELLGGPRAARRLPEHLDALLRRELLVRRATLGVADQHQWAFRQGVLRDAVYRTLTDADQKLGHRLAGEWLVEHASADASTLAEHFERGEVDERAAYYYSLAAEQALEGHDLELAEARAMRGLSLGAEGDVRGLLELCRAEALRWRGRYAEAKTSAEASLAATTPGSVRYFQAAANVIVASNNLGDVQAVTRCVVDVKASVPQRPARGRRLVCLCQAASALLGAGRIEECTTLLEEALASATAGLEREPIVAAWVQTIRAALALEAGDLEAYLARTAGAVDNYVLAADERHACNQRVRLGYGRMTVGDYEGAQAVLWQAQDGADRMGIPRIEAYATQNLGRAFALGGRLDEGDALLERAAQAGDALGDEVLYGGSLLYRVDIDLERGDSAAALRNAESALARLEAIPPLRTAALAARSRARLAAGDVAGAYADGAQALEAIGTLAGVQEAMPAVRIAFVEAARAQGDLEAAQEEVTFALKALAARHDRLSDPAVRERFLSIPDHARLARLGAELGL